MTNNITPLSDLKEQREARELAQSIKQSNALTYSLACYCSAPWLKLTH